MSPLAAPRLAAPSHGQAGKHISSFSLLVAGVKGPLYLHGEKQMNPRLCFPSPDAPPLLQGLFITSFHSQLSGKEQ